LPFLAFLAYAHFFSIGFKSGLCMEVRIKYHVLRPDRIQRVFAFSKMEMKASERWISQLSPHKKLSRFFVKVPEFVYCHVL
jgi:hypothetical protein